MITPQAQIVFVPIPVPAGATVDFGRVQKPAPYRRHKIERWGPAKEIPVNDRVANRRRIQELFERTRAERGLPPGCRLASDRPSRKAAVHVHVPVDDVIGSEDAEWLLKDRQSCRRSPPCPCR
jgi:hypothetical protein